MSNSVFLGKIFRDSCIELFEYYECDVQDLDESDLDGDNIFTALIDAGSDELEILIVLNIPYPILALTYPVKDIIQVTDEALEDWIMEILNMLMGKIKNKLLHYNCSLNLGLPESFCDIDISDVIPERCEQQSFLLSIDNEPIDCKIYFKFFDENISLENNVNTEVEVMEEGEIELF